jgi:hypothetical protein
VRAADKRREDRGDAAEHEDDEKDLGDGGTDRTDANAHYRLYLAVDDGGASGDVMARDDVSRQTDAGRTWASGYVSAFTGSISGDRRLIH